MPILETNEWTEYDLRLGKSVRQSLDDWIVSVPGSQVLEKQRKTIEPWIN